MSDTSGRITWGGPKAAVQRNFFEVYPRAGSGSRSRSAAQRKRPEPTTGKSPAGKIVWNPIQQQGRLTEKAFDALVPYLKRMAEFIEIAATSGMPGVVAEFGIALDSGFARLQKKIRAEISAGATSEFDPPAGRAFQVGSTTCAANLLKRQDPTKFMVEKIVEAVKNNPDFALIDSAQGTIEVFGERILTSILPGGQAALSGVGKIVRDFRTRLKSFMNRNSSAADWGSKAIAATIARLAQSLLE